MNRSNSRRGRGGGEAPGFPPPTPPFPPPPGKDLIFWRTESAEGEEREFEDILLRRVPSPVAHRFRGAAGARALTHAQYLTALVGLHEAMRRRVDQGDDELGAVLDQLGLRTVSI